MSDLRTVQGGTGRKRTSFLISQKPSFKTLLPHLTRPTTKAGTSPAENLPASGEGLANWSDCLVGWDVLGDLQGKAGLSFVL